MLRRESHPQIRGRIEETDFYRLNAVKICTNRLRAGGVEVSFARRIAEVYVMEIGLDQAASGRTANI